MRITGLDWPTSPVALSPSLAHFSAFIYFVSFYTFSYSFYAATLNLINCCGAIYSFLLIVLISAGRYFEDELVT